ncbi:hypothetical protein V1460_00895 [Streptomyces sp. SCSIO 30461]|uniref:hypothetical protein n=1 Tax=Streptomyces sp. SCSIO 30461 TaxID=3118085 RepID=UPI0030D3E439
MQMKSAPHLLSEDRAAYERILDDVLRQAHDRPDLAAVGERLNTEQLRTMALGATALITSAAAAEYEHFVKVREELRSSHAPSSADGSTIDLASSDLSEPGSGAGLGAVLTVLAPVLAGTTAVILLFVGYVLKALKPEPSFARTLLAAGWFFGALTAVSLLAAVIGLLITALRNSATEVPADETSGVVPEEVAEVARAREAWRHALLERGVIPFLRSALADPSAGVSSGTPRPLNRIPKVGYSGPDFTSPSEGSSGSSRPAFTSPDFTSPDFGPPEHQPD